MDFDVFISHASEDKESVVRPLAKLLQALDVKVWYDEFTLEVGDSLSESIDRGLANSRYGIVVLSPTFMKKVWTRRELQGMVAREVGGNHRILPIRHDLSHESLLEFSPTLADKKSISTNDASMHQIVYAILRVVKPEIADALLRRSRYLKAVQEGTNKVVEWASLTKSPILHETLSESQLVRIKIIQLVFADVDDTPLNNWIDNIRRDMYPDDEIRIYEKIVGVYLDVTQSNSFSKEKRRELYHTLVAQSLGIKNQQFKYLTEQDIDVLIGAIERTVPRIVTPVGTP